MISFPLLLVFFAEILSDLSPRGTAIYQIWQPYYLPHLKYSSIQLFLSLLFKNVLEPSN